MPGSSAMTYRQWFPTENFVDCCWVRAHSKEYCGLGGVSSSYLPLSSTWWPQRGAIPLEIWTWNIDKDLSFNIQRSGWSIQTRLYSRFVDNKGQTSGEENKNLDRPVYRTCPWPQELPSYLHAIWCPRRSSLFLSLCPPFPILHSLSSSEGRTPKHINQPISEELWYSRHMDFIKSSENPLVWEPRQKGTSFNWS